MNQPPPVLLQHPNVNNPGLNPASAVGTPPAGPTPHGPWPLAQPTHVFQQTTTTTLEWKISGLKSIFEQTRGETKSRVVKSALFGGGRWQILWYPNAGGPVGSEWTSLYLSCEPLPHEYLSHPPFPSSSAGASSTSSAGAQKLAPESRPFQRKGVHRFSFAISCGDKVIAAKEDKGHEFHTQASNWGWLSYCRRDALFFDNVLVRRLDYFVIRCEVACEPAPPRLPNPVLRTLVSTNLIDVVGKLLDQESVSDIEFVIAPRRRTPASAGRTIWANRTMLAAEYFQTMLSSGFAEDLRAGVATLELDDDLDSTPMASTGLPELEDSDRSDACLSSEDERDSDGADDDDEHFLSTSSPTPTSSSPAPSPSSRSTELPTSTEGEPRSSATGSSTAASMTAQRPGGEGRQSACASHAASDTSKAPTPRRKGPTKTRIVIRDASYPTYFALLYFLYTETITFAPLTSSFHPPATPTAASTDASQAAADSRCPSHAHHPSTASSSYRSFTSTAGPRWTRARARRAWIDEWCAAHPGRPRPASAKSIYMLSDKMGLGQLKAKAFNHLVDHLTVDNIAHEAFSNFSAAYDEVRKVHVEFFLQNWKHIKSTRAMHSIWHELRSGRHAGFEDVWPLIISQLEFVPRPVGLGAGGAADGGAGGGQALDFGPA